MLQTAKRDYSLLIANMLLTAVLCSLNHWVAIAKNRGDYTPFAVSPAVSSLTFDETYFYAPLPQRFMSTGQLPAEVDNYERRDSSAGIQFVPAVVLGGMGRVLGSLERAFIAADVLFPALALGLLYTASEGLVRNTSSRLLLAWGTLLIPWGPRNFLWRGYDSFLAAPDFTRTPQPEISFTLVLIAMLLSAHALEPSSKRGLAVAAGLVGALIVYSYYFYAIAWGMTLGLLLILTWLWRNWVLAKRTALMLFVMILSSIPYIWATARGRVQGGQSYLLARLGEYTHALHVVPFFVFSLGLILFWKFGKRFLEEQECQLRVVILLLLLLAGFAGLNFQVLSGYDAQHTHFWNRLILPVTFFLCGCWLLAAAERKWHRSRGLIAMIVGILICILLTAGARQVYVGTHTAELQRASRPEIELLKWVQSNVPVDSVIGTVDPNLILLIPTMSANFTYVPPGLRSLTPTGEIVDRYYELASLLGLSTNDVDSIAGITAHNGTDSHLLWTLRVFGEAIEKPPIHEKEVSQLVEMSSYAETSRTFAEGYRRYQQLHVDRRRRLDYVVCSPGTSIPSSIAQHFTHAHVLHVNQQYQLIALR